MLWFFWFVFSIFVGIIASAKGRSGIGWFVLAIVISPLIAVIVLLLAGENKAEMARRAIESGSMRKCDQCAELVQVDAIKCKHCGSTLGPVPPKPDRWSQD